MKRPIFQSAFLLSFALLSSCSLGSGLSSSACLGDSSTGSSMIGNSASGSDETFLVSCIPQNFHYQNENFALNNDVVLKEGNITGFFGYFINQEDLEKWQEYDQSADICYIVDENNAIYNYDLTGKLANRFELFLTDNEHTIALKANGHYLAYISNN